jgi:glycerol-3-phosphate dehydrogenase (NAD(P)+)
MLARQGRDVRLWARRPEAAARMTAERENRDYLRGVSIPPTVQVTADLYRAVEGAETIVIAAIASFVRELAADVAPLVARDSLILHGTKGLEPVTWRRISVVLADTLGPLVSGRIAVLSGPNHAEEVARGLPTASVLACADDGVALRLQRLLGNPHFRVYTNRDVAGVELCSAAKNVIALACGIGDGLGYGDNSKAALITRALAELWRLVERHGGSFATVAGLAGVGDVIATCTSRHSRNRWAGERIGRGNDLGAVVASTPMVIEGIPATRGIVSLAREAGVDMPICEGVHRILFEGQRPEDTLRELMGREWTAEA